MYLRGPYRNLELGNRKVRILPPALGEGNMLNLTDLTSIEQLNPLTKFKLFEYEDAIRPSNSSIPLCAFVLGARGIDESGGLMASSHSNSLNFVRGSSCSIPVRSVRLSILPSPKAGGSIPALRFSSSRFL